MSIIKRGTLLIIECGEYSDFRWAGPVRMLKDATKEKLAELYKMTGKPANKFDDRPSPDDFLPWLISAGWAEDFSNVQTWHAGSYGEFNLE